MKEQKGVGLSDSNKKVQLYLSLEYMCQGGAGVAPGWRRGGAGVAPGGAVDSVIFHSCIGLCTCVMVGDIHMEGTMPWGVPLLSPAFLCLPLQNLPREYPWRIRPIEY